MLLSISSVRSFWDEIEKIAAPVEVLRAARKRLGVVRMPIAKGKGDIVERALRKGNMNAQAVAGGGHGIIPTSKTAAKPAYTRALARANVQAMGHNPDSYVGSGMRSQVEAMVKEQLSTTFKPLTDRHGGKIIQAKGDNARRLHGLGVIPAMSPEGRKATNIGMSLHEGFERKAMGKHIAPGYGHLSPKVIMDESNMLKKMTGPGSDEARTAFADFRQRSGEPRDIENAVSKAYGPKGAEALKQHGFTKAMKKDLMRRFRSGEAKWG